MKTRYIIATVLYCAAIFWESSLSEPNKTGIHFSGDDKIAHMLVYGGLAALVSVGIRRSGSPVSRSWQLWAPVAFAALYGVSDELHQCFIPMRSSDLFDVIADTAGALLVQLALCKYVWKTLWSRQRV